MKVLLLSVSGAKKALKNNFELYESDVVELSKSITPGEWCLLFNERKKKIYTAFINPGVKKSIPSIHILEEIPHEEKRFEVENYIEKLLAKSIERRMVLIGYQENSRLVYGRSDSLPGLIVDSYLNYIFIQINTAGLDLHRQFIFEYFKNKFPNKKVFLLNKGKYRENELLPEFPTPQFEDDIEILENNLKYIVGKSTFQKVGYYYDHRENRKRAAQVLQKIDKKFTNGLDLFCYIGSWGLNLLSTTCEHMDFVDQGNFDDAIKANLKSNGFEGRGQFFRENVFDFLKDAVTKGVKYDVICSDPPAFCKSKREKQKAYEGYLKVHRRCMNLLTKNGVLLAASCTQYIGHDEFQKNIEEAAELENRKVRLIDVGVQGYDHPISSFENKSSYLKYYAYIVE